MGELITGPGTVRTKSDLRGSVLTLNPIFYWLFLVPQQRSSAETQGIWKQLGTPASLPPQNSRVGLRTGFGITEVKKVKHINCPNGLRPQNHHQVRGPVASRQCILVSKLLTSQTNFLNNPVYKLRVASTKNKKDLSKSDITVMYSKR